MIETSYSDVALTVWKQHLASCGLDHYAGIVSLQAFARLAKIMKSEEILKEAKENIKPLWQGKVPKAGGVYGDRVYRWGGNATAFMVLRGMLPEAYDALVATTDDLCKNQHRDSRGIFDMPNGNRRDGSKGFIWIDTVFGVCPFLLWTGLAAKRQDFIDESCFQMLKHHEILFNKELKIYHQAINYDAPGELTPSFWSRGCGWGALALAEMVYDLPKDHKNYPAIHQAFQDLMEGCRNHMDEDGMLHQAMATARPDEDTTAEAVLTRLAGASARQTETIALSLVEMRDVYVCAGTTHIWSSELERWADIRIVLNEKDADEEAEPPRLYLSGLPEGLVEALHAVAVGLVVDAVHGLLPRLRLCSG